MWSNSNGNSYYYLTDGLGSVRQIVNASGQVLQAYDYDAFGTPTVTNPSIQSRFGYTGREYDAETGLYQYRAREYSPTLGRYLQRDPIGFADDYNLYRYVKNNPLNSVDPSGLEVESSIYGGNFDPQGADNTFGLGSSSDVFNLSNAILGGLGGAISGVISGALAGSWGGEFTAGAGALSYGILGGIGGAVTGGFGGSLGWYGGAIAGAMEGATGFISGAVQGFSSSVMSSGSSIANGSLLGFSFGVLGGLVTNQTGAIIIYSIAGAVGGAIEGAINGNSGNNH